VQKHKPIEELVHNNDDVLVQIIFTVPNDNEDKRAAPVRHLAIAERNNEPLIKQALDSWYLAEQKDYEMFAAKYPMNGELQRQGEKLEAMSIWCYKNEIIFTPTFVWYNIVKYIKFFSRQNRKRIKLIFHFCACRGSSKWFTPILPVI